MSSVCFSTDAAETYANIQSELGEFLKQGKTFKMQQRRYFSISNNSLVYYKNRIIEKKPRGIVDLKDCTFEVQRTPATPQPSNSMICVRGNNNTFTIWILPKSDKELRFFMFYLEAAKQGLFNSNALTLDPISNPPPPLPNLANDHQNNIPIHIKLKEFRSGEDEEYLLLHTVRDENTLVPNNIHHNINKNEQLNSAETKSQARQETRAISNASFAELESDHNVINNTYRSEYNH